MKIRQGIHATIPSTIHTTRLSSKDFNFGRNFGLSADQNCGALTVNESLTVVEIDVVAAIELGPNLVDWKGRG